jgi:hypothetical protein
MSGDPSKKQPGRPWDLGKEAPARKPVEPKPQPKPAATPRPERLPQIPKPLPLSAGLPDEEPASSSVQSSQALPSRPAAKPKTLREWLNHPFALIGAGLAICFGLFMILFLGPSGMMPGGGTAAPPAPERVITGILAADSAIEQTLGVEGRIAESPVLRDARLLIATGEILDKVAEFRSADEQGRQQQLDTFLHYSEAVYRAPLETDDEGIGELLRQEAALQTTLLGRRAVEQARAANITAADIRTAAVRLLTEGLALAERQGEEGIAKFALARGAGNRLALVGSAESGATTDRVVRGLFEPSYAQAVEQTRRRHYPAEAARP